MDEVTWGALALALTALGGLYTWWALRHRGPAAGLRGAGLSLLPVAAWLTGTLELATEVAGSVADWATHLVLSPVVWLGVALGGLAVLLLVVAGFVPERRRDAAPPPRGPRTLPSGGEARGEPAIDDDMAEIEALLRKRGIS